MQLQVIVRLHILQCKNSMLSVTERTQLLSDIFGFLDLLAFYQIENRFLPRFIDEIIFPV
jgi:hypothetical protein